jgi:hypothetical protein
MPDASPETANITRWAISIAVPAISGFVGILIGAWISSKQQKQQRKLTFIEDQLKYFYSPLLGLRNEIIILRERQYDINRNTDENWRKMCKDAREIGGIDNLKTVVDERREEYMSTLKYNNRQITEILLPSYRHMVSIFREYYYLADPHTRKHFGTLLGYVDIWDRWLSKSIPPEVIKDIGHSEKILDPFYDEIEEIHNALHTKLANSKT